MEDTLAASIVQRIQKLESKRMTWHQQWQDIRELVRPIASDFTRQVVPGEERTRKIFDGTAPDALEELASGLQSYLTNPTERWFGLTIDNAENLRYDAMALEWLDTVANIIYAVYSDERSNFNPAMHEGYLDIGSFGTCVTYQEWDKDLNHIVFQSFPLADCFVAESKTGRVDTLYRKVQYTGRQLLQEFPDITGDVLDKVTKRNLDEEWAVIHACYPNSDRNPKKLTSKNKKFASVWVLVDGKVVLRQSGYDSFPYHCARWTKLSRELYGRGPGMKILPDIRMVNAMARTLIKVGEKIADPPLQLPSDGFLLPLKTHPGALMFREPGADKAEPLEIGANLNFTFEQVRDKQDSIRRGFYADWLKMEKQNIQMTATEVQDRRDEKLRMLAPMLGRVCVELLQPTIERTFYLLVDHGMIPPSPKTLRGKNMKPEYSSPAAIAQTSSRAVSAGRFLQDLVPYAQMDPTIMDVVDMDKYAEEIALDRGVPRRILRSPDDIKKMRAARAQQQQAQQAVAAAEPASQALKNVADASSKSPGLVGGLM